MPHTRRWHPVGPFRQLFGSVAVVVLVAVLAAPAADAVSYTRTPSAFSSYGAETPSWYVAAPPAPPGSPPPTPPQAPILVGSGSVVTTSNVVLYHGFSFSIPSGYVVAGVRVDWEAGGYSGEGARAVEITEVSLRTTSGALFHSATPKTQLTRINDPSTGGYPDPYYVTTRGGSSDMWGMSGTNSAIRQSLMASTFAVGFRVRGSAAPGTYSLWVTATRPPTVTVYAIPSCPASGVWPATPSGSTHNIGCSTGETGVYRRYCSPLGWQSPEDTCQVITNYCPLLSPPTHGTISTSCASQRAYGEKCQYFSCNTGYTQTGSTSRTCLSSQTWSGSAMVCSLDASFCGPVPAAPANAVTATCSSAIGTVCTHTCEPGYESAASLSTTCSSSGTWTVTSFPACTLIPLYCPALGATVDGVTPSHSRSRGSTASPFTCNTGYVPSGSSSRTCMPSTASVGVWSGSALTCTENSVHCPTTVSPPANGQFGACSQAISGTCEYECNPGYVANGNMELTCTAGTTWSGSLGTCDTFAGYCTPYGSPANGVISGCTGAIGEVCGPPVCAVGYVPSGTTHRTCEAGPGSAPGDGVWSGSPPSCIVDTAFCPDGPPGPGNGTRVACSRQLGGQCEYTCNAGYGPPTSVLVCDAGQTWLGPAPVCSPVDDYCPDTLSLPDGTVPSCNNRINEWCGPMSCDPGRTPVGDLFMRCNGAGEWEGVFPFCSNTDPVLTRVVSPQTVVVSADGPGWSFSVEPITNANTSVTVGSDIVALTLASAPPALSTPSLATPVWNTVSAFSVLYEPFVAGTFSHNILINGFVIGLSPYSLVVLPGAPSAAQSVASGDGLGVVANPADAFFDNTEVFVAVAPRDLYANAVPVADNPPTPLFAASVKAENGMVVPVAYRQELSGAATGYVYSYSVPEGGLYTLSLSLGGQPVDASPWLVQVRALCPPGTMYAELTGPCEPCPANTYSIADRSACAECPTGTLSPKASINATACTCSTGFYTRPGAAGKCEPCPTGAVCAGGGAQPVALAGWASVNGELVRCPRRASCLGSGQCAAGYSGTQCERCAVKYYRLSGECFPCNEARSWLLGILAVIVLQALVCVLVYVNSREAHNRLYAAAAFVIGFNSLQISALYGEIDVEWHIVAKRFFDALSVANLNLELASPECSVAPGDPWVFKFVMMALLPLVLVAFLAVAYVCGRIHRHLVATRGAAWIAERPDWDPERETRSLAAKVRRRAAQAIGVTELSERALRSAVVRTFFQLCTFCYLPLTLVALRFFECDDLGPAGWVLASDRAVPCYDARYWGMFPVAVIAGIAYALGIPLGTLYTLRRLRAQLDRVTFFLKYGFLVARFIDSHYYFETLIMARKLGVVLALVAFQAGQQEAAMGALVMIAALLHVARERPYARHFHNHLELGATFTGALVLMGAMTQSDWLRHTLVLSGLTANVVIILFGMGSEFRTMLKTEEDDMLMVASAAYAGDCNAGDVDSGGLVLHAASLDDSGMGESMPDIELRSGASFVSDSPLMSSIPELDPGSPITAVPTPAPLPFSESDTAKWAGSDEEAL